MNHEPESQTVTNQDLAALRKEDAGYPQVDDPRGLNGSESRDMHHRDLPQWAGNRQNEFGTHRRGPPARDW